MNDTDVLMIKQFRGRLDINIAAFVGILKFGKEMILSSDNNLGALRGELNCILHHEYFLYGKMIWSNNTSLKVLCHERHGPQQGDDFEKKK